MIRRFRSVFVSLLFRKCLRYSSLKSSVAYKVSTKFVDQLHPQFCFKIVVPSRYQIECPKIRKQKCFFNWEFALNTTSPGHFLFWLYLEWLIHSSLKFKIALILKQSDFWHVKIILSWKLVAFIFDLVPLSPKLVNFSSSKLVFINQLRCDFACVQDLPRSWNSKVTEISIIGYHWLISQNLHSNSLLKEIGSEWSIIEYHAF